jgi:hypothetical protein
MRVCQEADLMHSGQLRLLQNLCGVLGSVRVCVCVFVIGIRAFWPLVLQNLGILLQMLGMLGNSWAELV